MFASAGDGKKRFHHHGRVRASFLQQSLRDERTAAASGPHYIHAAPATLQDFERGNPNLRLVVIGERIVEQRYGGPSDGALLPRISSQPFLKRLPRPGRKRSPIIQAQQFVIQPAARQAAGDPIPTTCKIPQASALAETNWPTFGAVKVTVL